MAPPPPPPAAQQQQSLGPSDIAGLFECLKGALEPTSQKQAEAALKSLEARPGFCSCLTVSTVSSSPFQLPITEKKILPTRTHLRFLPHSRRPTQDWMDTLLRRRLWEPWMRTIVRGGWPAQSSRTVSPKTGAPDWMARTPYCSTYPRVFIHEYIYTFLHVCMYALAHIHMYVYSQATSSELK